MGWKTGEGKIAHDMHLGEVKTGIGDTRNSKKLPSFVSSTNMLS